MRSQDPKGTRGQNPGPPKRNPKRERDIIVISDEDEGEESRQAAGEPSTLDLWDDLVKNRPGQWDIRDVLMHGETSCQDDRVRTRNNASGKRVQKLAKADVRTPPLKRQVETP